MFCGLPNGSNMPQRFAAMPWSTNTGATRSSLSHVAKQAAARGRSASNAMSFVTNIEARAVMPTSANTSKRTPEHAATTRAASTWMIPEALSPPTASNMLASLARVPQSTYPAYPAAGRTSAHVKSAATTATDGIM